jgi:hypothetical protein
MSDVISKELFLNGINADTGGPIDGDLVITADMIAKVARGQRLTPEDLRDAKMRRNLDSQKEAHFGVAEGIDDTDIAQTGWSMIFPASLPQKSVDAIKEALKPLIDLRKEQAAAVKETYYKEVIGPDLGYKNGESKNDFLKRFGRGPGAADPEYFPYYALIVGSPESIPFTFQYQLDVQYAVGRIYFDRLDDYYQYASSVVAAETKKFTRSKKAVFFGVSNPDDRATSMSTTSLIQPLATQMRAQYKDWGVEVVDPQKATKANLSNYLGGAQTPSLLFTASHGMNFKLDDPRLLRHTGALLCQDWPGPKVRGPITDKLYFSADDIASDADVFGMLAFVFACYGGGIPKSDNFYRQAFGSQKDIAPYAFLSQLPLRLLSHPRGGALGVFAHVERAWGSSIQWDGAVNDVETFDSMTDALLNGKPAGAASEYFNGRYAEISTMLTDELDSSNPENQDEVKLAGMWTSNNDARNYTFIGDPAVRLAVGDKETPVDQRASLGALVSKVPADVASVSASFQPDIVDRTPTVAATSGGPGANFGIGDFFKKETEPVAAQPSPVVPGGGLNDSLTKLVNKLGDYLSKALDDATSLEVSTFVADDMNNVVYDAGKFTGAQLRAVTRISLDGDTLVCVPEKDGEVDLTVWNIHLEMVRTAQSNRAELMKTIVGAVSGVAGLLK